MLKEKLQEELRTIIDENLIRYLPSRYPQLGSAILIRLKKELIPYREIIGDKILEMNKSAESVWLIKSPTTGMFREPHVECIAGDCNPIVIHKELKTKFIIDISKLTFSPGNAGERRQLVEIVNNNQVIVDFFACCGNLSLPIAVNKKIKRLIAIEANAYAYSFLIENIVLNKLIHVVSPFLMDNHYWSSFNIADHVLLGFLPAPDLYQVELAVRTLRPQGGIIHYHWISSETKYKKDIDKLISFIESMSRNTQIIDIHKIKSLSPRINHYVARIYVFMKQYYGRF